MSLSRTLRCQLALLAGSPHGCSLTVIALAVGVLGFLEASPGRKPPPCPQGPLLFEAQQTRSRFPSAAHWVALAFSLCVLAECDVCVTSGVAALCVFAKQMAWALLRDRDEGPCLPRGSLSWGLECLQLPVTGADRAPWGQGGHVSTQAGPRQTGLVQPRLDAHSCFSLCSARKVTPFILCLPLSPPGANSLQTRGSEQGDLQVRLIRQHPSQAR